MLKFEKTLPWAWFAIALLSFCLDQWSKVLATTNLDYDQPLALTTFFSWTLRHNNGIAFSLFDDPLGPQRWILVALASAVSMVIAVWIIKVGRKRWLEACGLALVLGGAVGNLYDRATLGYVVDFIELHYAGYYWPAFNIADSSISIGAALLIWDGLFSTRSKEKK